MKYKGIFGFVLVIHMGLAVFIVTQPGCQSTQSSNLPADPVIGPVAEEDLESMETESVAPTVVEPAEDLFESLNPAFNTGAPEPVVVSSQAQSDFSPEPTGASARSEPLRPQAPMTPEVVGVLDYASPPVEESFEPEMMTVMVDAPVDQTYAVESGDSLWAISKKFGVSVSSIQANNNLSGSNLRVGQILMIPGKSREVSVAAPPSEVASPSVSQDIAGRQYVVVPRDTLSGIAQKTGVPVSIIRSSNDLKGDLIRVGDILILPEEGDVPAPVSTSLAAPASLPQEGVYHVVESGENPTLIARKYGLTVKELLQKNGNFDPRAMRIGQRLLVGDISEAPAPVEVEMPQPPVAPVVPEGFKPVAPQAEEEISAEVPRPAPAFDEEAFIREIEDAPIVSPVPVE